MPSSLAGAGDWGSGAGAADTWNDGADAGAKSDGDFGATNGNFGTTTGDFGATNGEVTGNGDKPGGDFTCRR